eukprot:scaffold19983_cov26-Tisochrysis_lutea.AAC.3
MSGTATVGAATRQLPNCRSATQSTGRKARLSSKRAPTSACGGAVSTNGSAAAASATAGAWAAATAAASMA